MASEHDNAQMFTPVAFYLLHPTGLKAGKYADKRTHQSSQTLTVNQKQTRKHDNTIFAANIGLLQITGIDWYWVGMEKHKSLCLAGSAGVHCTAL